MSRKLMSSKVSRRAVLAGTAAGAAAALGRFPTPAIAESRALPARPAHGEDRPAGARRHPDGAGRPDLSEGKQLHDGRPQGRLRLRRHRRQSGRHQDQGPGAGRARQGRRDPRPARRFRALRHQRLHQRAENADAQSRGGRQSHPARAQSVSVARVGDLVAGDAADGALRGDRIEAQARRHDLGRLRLRLRADGRFSGGVRQGRRLHRQQALAAAVDARLHALCGADRRLRRRLPGLCRVEPAALHEGLCGRRLEISGGDRRNRRRRRAAQEFRRRGDRPDRLLPLHARSRDRRQSPLHRRHDQELRRHPGPVCGVALRQLPGRRCGAESFRRQCQRQGKIHGRAQGGQSD